MGLGLRLGEPVLQAMSQGALSHRVGQQLVRTAGRAPPRVKLPPQKVQLVPLHAGDLLDAQRPDIVQQVIVLQLSRQRRHLDAIDSLHRTISPY